MKCPKCATRTKVVDSRPVGTTVQRQRRCPKCKLRFSTIEWLRSPEVVL